MITVGAFEAKTKLSALLDKVEAGEDVMITRHGKPIARITNIVAEVKRPNSDLVARINALAAKSTLGNNSLKEMRDFGRKW
jgi:prevent-host-death family protein